ncbi:MAG: hypothetical protein EAX81_03020 [Candidatus Thorarchaeota archaeon]|nr:hypothetical protein [Candidatus Thorarchaeota archaeon]
MSVCVYCHEYDEHFHADVDAARNTMYIQEPTTVCGRTAYTSCPSLSNLQLMVTLKSVTYFYFLLSCQSTTFIFIPTILKM